MAITGAPRVKYSDPAAPITTLPFTTRGYLAAFDAESGKEAWRFYTVPGDPKKGFENKAMETAAKTWTGQWWLHGGGGNAWHGFTYDAELDQLYIGTGNGSPWNRKIRSPEGGDNLFLCSIVALNPDVVTLDIEMPRMDGYEVASHVRNDPRLRHIPIVMITSRVGEKHRARAIELGVNDSLGKPYQEAQLMQALEPLLPHGRAK